MKPRGNCRALSGVPHPHIALASDRPNTAQSATFVSTTTVHVGALLRLKGEFLCGSCSIAWRSQSWPSASAVPRRKRIRQTAVARADRRQQAALTKAQAAARPDSRAQAAQPASRARADRAQRQVPDPAAPVEMTTRTAAPEPAQPAPPPTTQLAADPPPATPTRRRSRAAVTKEHQAPAEARAPRHSRTAMD
jgi:hypothetical protein